jgi:hypothetical protein
MNNTEEALDFEQKHKEDTGNSSGDTLVLVEKGASPIVVSDTVNSKNTVSNWQNTGVVYATGMYAGGISGYNTGSLLENLDTSGAVTVAGEYPVSHAADYDEGITGTKKHKRTELMRMMKDCENGLIDYIITKSISNTYRSIY